MLPASLARGRVQTRDDTAVVDDVELVAYEERGGGERRSPPQRPRDVRPGHVARAIRANRDERRLLETGRDVHEPVAVHRTRHVREAVAVADTPDFLAGLRLARRRAERSDADDF